MSSGHICYIEQKRKKRSQTTKRNGKMENNDRPDIKWVDMENPPQVFRDVASKNIPDEEWPSSREDVYGLKAALLKACNPSRFMEPEYDIDKVSGAIEIYKKLKDAAPCDLETLALLRKDAETALGIRLDTNAFYHHLIKVFSPGKYVENYQEELLMKNHEICSRLTENKDSIQGLENILKEVESPKVKIDAKEEYDFTTSTEFVVAIAAVMLMLVAILLLGIYY